MTTIAEGDEQARRNIFWKYKIDNYNSNTKKKDFKNCLLEFEKQQEISRKQETEKFENQRLEDLKGHRKELVQQEKSFSKLLETFSKRENDPGSSNIFLGIP